MIVAESVRVAVAHEDIMSLVVVTVLATVLYLTHTHTHTHTHMHTNTLVRSLFLTLISKG